MRLIDVDEFMEKFYDIEFNAKHELFGESRDLALEGLKHIKKALKEMPTIDPVKHGRWIVVKDMVSHIQCSECGDDICWVNTKRPKYCPSCGAKMDGKEE